MAYMNAAKRDDWTTPLDLFDELEAEFGFFDLDAAASDENARCELYYTEADDGLAQEWFGQVFVNPPYGRVISEWVEKAIREWTRSAPRGSSCSPVEDWEPLVPPQRPPRRRDHFRGRLKFGGATTSAPFVPWWCSNDQGGAEPNVSPGGRARLRYINTGEPRTNVRGPSSGSTDASGRFTTGAFR